jgi:hypothetical protein
VVAISELALSCQPERSRKYGSDYRCGVCISTGTPAMPNRSRYRRLFPDYRIGVKRTGLPLPQRRYGIVAKKTLPGTGNPRSGDGSAPRMLVLRLGRSIPPLSW